MNPEGVFETKTIRQLGRLAVTVMLAVALAGCNVQQKLEAYVRGTPAQQSALHEEFIAYVHSDNGASAMGPLALYMDVGQYLDLLVDHHSMMRYTVGVYLALDPNAALYFQTVASAGLFPISRSRLDEYIAAGDLFVRNLRTRPENRYLAERELLFLKRTGSVAMDRSGDFNKVLDLIRDGDRFLQFLTDDDYAREVMADIRGRLPSQVTIYEPLPQSSITPGTGS